MNQTRSGSGTATKVAAAGDAKRAKMLEPSGNKAPRLRGGVLIPDAPTGKVVHSGITPSKAVARSPRSKPADTNTGTGATQGITKPRHQPNWVVWQGRPMVSLFSAVCLVHNITPGQKYVIKLKELGDPRYQHFEGHLITLKQWQQLDGRLRAIPASDARPTDGTDISLYNFIQFVKDQMPFAGITIPHQFWQLKPPQLPLLTATGQSAALQNQIQPNPVLDTRAQAENLSVPGDAPQSPALPESMPLKNQAADAEQHAPAPDPKPTRQRRRKQSQNDLIRNINLDQPGMLSIEKVLALMSISRSGWYDGIKKKIYPAPVSLGGKRRVGWTTAEIKKLVDGLAAGGTKT